MYPVIYIHLILRNSNALQWRHMGTMAPQITSPTIVYSTVIQTQIKENIKARRHWPLCGEFTGTGEFPAQRASNAENVPILWRHHGKQQTSLPGIYTRPLTKYGGTTTWNILPHVNMTVIGKVDNSELIVIIRDDKVTTGITITTTHISPRSLNVKRVIWIRTTPYVANAIERPNYTLDTLLIENVHQVFTDSSRSTVICVQRLREIVHWDHHKRECHVWNRIRP